MRITGSQARARVGHLVERIALLEAALGRCRDFADQAAPETAYHYCSEIENVAAAALDGTDA